MIREGANCLRGCGEISIPLMRCKNILLLTRLGSEAKNYQFAIFGARAVNSNATPADKSELKHLLFNRNKFEVDSLAFGGALKEIVSS